MPSSIADRSRLTHHLPTLMKIVSAIAILFLLSISAGFAQEFSEIEHLKTMANSGDYKSAHQLGLAYAVGDGVEKDRKASDYWYSVAASLRDQKTSDQVSKQPKTADDASPATPVMSPYFYAKPNSGGGSSQGQFTFGSRNNSGSSMFDSKPTTQQSTADVPDWKKVVNAVVAAPAKAKAFLSDHSDDLTEVAEFAIEQYLTGSEPSGGTISKAEASDAGRSFREYRDQQNK